MSGNTVVVATSGATGPARAAYSPTDITWSYTSTMPLFANSAASQWESVAYSPSLGRFCAVAVAQGNNNNGIATSDDNGATWTGRSNGPTSGLNKVIWVGGSVNLFVAAGSSTIWTSPTGVTWTNQTVAQANPWTGLAYSPSLGLIVAVATSGVNQVQTSPDGVNWTVRTHSTAGCTCVAWDATLALFCAIGSGSAGHTATSSNGTTWADNDASASLTFSSWVDIAASDAGGFMVVGGNGGQVAFSTTGTTAWTRTNSVNGGGSGNQGVGYSKVNGLWVVVGQSALSTSPNGTTFTARTIGSNALWVAVAEGAVINKRYFGAMIF